MNNLFEKPIVFFDLETTHKSTEQARIVEITCIKLISREKIIEKTMLINPEIDIPQESTDIHGIKNEDVANAPTFKKIANSLLDFITGCNIGGFNIISYDKIVLYNEFKRSLIEWNFNEHKYIDSFNIFRRKEERTLSKAVEFYCDKILENSHSSLADTKATIDVFFKQLERYSDINELSIDELALYSSFDIEGLDIEGKFVKKNGKIFYNFGKYSGNEVKNTRDDIDFLNWVLGKDFSSNVKETIKKIILPNILNTQKSL